MVIVFGAVIILDASFPTYIPLNVLDLSNVNESQVASAYLMKACSHCEQMCRVLPDLKKASIVEIPMRLNLDSYYVKKYNNSVFERGLGLFDDDFSVGLHHMMDVFNKLYAFEDSRHVVEFPLPVRTAESESNDFQQIIYRDLCKLGYTCGVPNRIANLSLFETYKNDLIAAVAAIHKAGVLHCDLYISNVMWKLSVPLSESLNESTNQDDSSIESISISDVTIESPDTSNNKYIVDIKIIDWDASHCLKEGNFAPNVHTALVNYLRNHSISIEPKFGIEWDLMYLNVLNSEVSNELAYAGFRNQIGYGLLFFMSTLAV